MLLTVGVHAGASHGEEVACRPKESKELYGHHFGRGHTRTFSKKKNYNWVADKIPILKPKRRSWILVFSRKERKDRKAYREWRIARFPGSSSILGFHHSGELPYRTNGVYNH